jgi:N-acetylglucosaminyldiphosphoundecaprenol N-acetyl-beta-D-mannosaminyltransferase
MIAERPASIDILGCRVDAIGRDEAIARIVAAAQVPKTSLVVTLGVEMVMHAQRDPRFRALVDRADLSLCDTIGIMLASRLRRGPLRERVTGVDLIGPLAKRSAEHGDLRLFLFGGAPGVVERAAASLIAVYPGVRIAGIRNGHFTATDLDGIIASITASGANVILVGLGSPKQEFWLEENLVATGASVGIGVGGSFDVIAGRKQRAPVVVRRLGLEWFFRLLQEPSRWRRQLALPKFAFAATREALQRKGSIER